MTASATANPVYHIVCRPESPSAPDFRLPETGGNGMMEGRKTGRSRESAG